MNLLRLSKKSKWRILAILTSIKINYLPGAKYSQKVKYQVFRQARYVAGNLGDWKIIVMRIIHRKMLGIQQVS
jgi:hypothetical protein